MNPLKPCPFCLTDGDERLIELWDTFDAGHIAHIHCTHCGADGPSVYGEMGAAPTIARARSMWNGRAEYLKTPNVGVTPWFPVAVDPVHEGIYEVEYRQSRFLFRREWRDGVWAIPGAVLLPATRPKRWRGLTAPTRTMPKDQR